MDVLVQYRIYQPVNGENRTNHMSLIRWRKIESDTDLEMSSLMSPKLWIEISLWLMFWVLPIYAASVMNDITDLLLYLNRCLAAWKCCQFPARYCCRFSAKLLSLEKVHLTVLYITKENNGEQFGFFCMDLYSTNLRNWFVHIFLLLLLYRLFELSSRKFGQ